MLEHFGYQVQVPMQHLCCGRPLYDYGFLDQAQTLPENVLHALADDIEAGTPMVVLEPSCCSVFRDELNGLMPESERAHRLTENTFLLSEFLEKKVKDYQAAATAAESHRAGPLPSQGHHAASTTKKP